jgi:hypothetical protein
MNSLRILIAVPFVGSMRQKHEEKTLQRLRKIDDDLRWVTQLHEKWIKFDYVGERAAF